MFGLFLPIVGLVLIVVFAIQVFKTAVDTQRNAALWTIAIVVVGLAVQFVLPFFVGVGIGIYWGATGGTAESFSAQAFGLLTVIDIAAVGLSVVAMVMIMKVVSRIEDDPVSLDPSTPPPPPTFGDNE